MTLDTEGDRSPAPRARSARMNFRVSEEQKTLLEEAAALSGRSLTDFVLVSAQTAANDILAERTSFTLSPKQWEAFTAALERPPRELPRIAALLSSPSVLDPE